jgi:hypothetical protein
MKPRNALIIFIIAIALVILLLIFENPFSGRQMTPSEGTGIEKVEIFQGVTADNCAKIEISRFDGRTTASLSKMDGVWYTNAENGHVADAKVVEAVFNALTGVGEGEVVSRNPENQPKFGVDKMLGTHAKFYDSAGNLLEDVFVGRSRSRDFMSSYVRKDGSNEVLKVSAMLPYLFERGGQEAWREHTIFDFDPGQIVAINIESAKDRYNLLKYASGEWELIEPKKLPAERTVAEQVSRVLARLRAIGFEDNEENKPLSEFDLHIPRFIVTASLQDYSTTPVLYIGKEDSEREGRFFAKRPDREQIYLISKYQAEAFTTKPSEFLKEPEAKREPVEKPEEKKPTPESSYE